MNPHDLEQGDGGAPGRKVLALGAVLGALGVIAGAFGAHGLEERVTPEQLAWWKTGALYHLLHAPVVCMAGLLAERTGGRGRAAGALLTLGVAIFSGTLYAMTLGGPRILGAVTPIGGTLLIAGWLALAWAAMRKTSSS